MRISSATLGVAFLITILAPSLAWAAPTYLNVRIEGRSETLFEGPIWTEGHDVRASSDSQERSCNGVDPLDPENNTPGPTPTASSVDAMSLIGEGFDGEWYPGYEDYFVTRWGPDEQSPAKGAYWGVLVNDVFTNVGGCQYDLHEYDEVLWLYNAFNDRANLALFPAGDSAARPPLTATAQLNKPFVVEVLDYGDAKEDSPPSVPDREAATPYSKGAEIAPVLTSAKGFEKIQTESPEAVTTDGEGKASVTFTTPGWHRIKAGTPLNAEGEEQAIRSNRIDVCVPAPGETGCGAPPAEDDVRTPPATPPPAPEEEGHAKATETLSGGQPALDDDSSSTIQAGSNDSIALQPSAPRTQVSIASVNLERLLLKLTGAGVLYVRIARQAGSTHHRRWLTIKTITVKVGAAGRVEVKLPRLARGRYRLRISLAGANGVTRMLSVARR